MRFWVNVGLIGAAHAVLVVALVRWSHETKDSSAQSIVWMNGGEGDGNFSEKKSAPSPKPMKASTPRMERTPQPSKNENEEDERPVLTSAKSDIQLPPLRPSPTSTSTPARTPQPSVTPKVKVPPKPSPKPKPTPKPSPKKIILAKASPKPSPKIKSEDEDANAEKAVETEEKKIAIEKKEEPDAAKKEKVSNSSPSPGGGGRIGGGGNESRFGWYGSMLHDRFYSEWVQPTNIASPGAKLSVLVKLRIESDGRVSSFETVRSSGNSELDESVKAIASRMTRVEPLPAGLGNGDHYDVKINFELNSE